MRDKNIHPEYDEEIGANQILKAYAKPFGLYSSKFKGHGRQIYAEKMCQIEGY